MHSATDSTLASAIAIRSARADDRGPIAELMFSSAVDLYSYLYEDRALDFLRYEFASGIGIAGYPNVTVAVLNDDVVGVGCFYDLAQCQKFRQESFENLQRFFRSDELPAVFERFRPLREYVQPPGEGELYLANFGVAPSLRSQGIGAQMLQQKIAWAKANGYTVFGLDVSVRNPRGQALYSRMGLSIKREINFPLASADLPAARKMELLLIKS